jgi:hypothetical protein
VAEVTLDGDRALAPDGTQFAKRFKKGVFTFGDTSILDFVRDNPTQFADVPACLVNVVEAVSQNEGKLEAVNTWDDSFITFGALQWTAGVGNARGELGALLDRLKRERPDVFGKLFGSHGLDVANVAAGPPANAGVTPVGSLVLEGELLDTAEKKEQLRTLDWAYRFWLAGHNDAMRAVEVRQAIDRVQIFYRSPKHTIDGRIIADYVKSEVGVALLLDQHVNRPGHVPKTLAAAVTQLANAPGDSATWTDDEEQELLHTYIELRAATNMTDSDKRAQAVLEAASSGLVSTRRGSFDI